MAKIDVLLPYWGDFELFKKAVESVLIQSEKDWKLYVVDDCYPTFDAQNYIQSLNDPRITYYRHEKNIGITKNFNFALTFATSKHCVMLGCDDKLLPNYIERALSRINEAEFYQPSVGVIDDEDKQYLPLADRIKDHLRPKKPGVYSGEKLAVSLCHGNWLYFPSIVWKTSVIKSYGFNENYKIVEDVLLEFSILKDGGTLYVDNEKTFQYRRSKNSLSSKEKSKDGIRFNEENEVYSNLSKDFASIGWKKAAVAAKLRVTSRIHKLLS